MKKLTARMLLILLLAGLTACQFGSTPVPLPSPTLTGTFTPVPPTPTVTPTITPTPQLNSPSGPPLRLIRMFNVKDGWGLIEDALLVTHDGGLSWASVPLPGGQVDKSTEPIFFDVWTVYLVVPAPDGRTGQFLSTTNGGASWTVVPVPFAHGQLIFRDGIRFFLETGETASDTITFYRTNDYGGTWEKVVPTSDSTNSLPPSGLKTGASFITWENGILGFAAQPQKVGAYQTTDSAQTWTPLEIPVPQNIDSLTITVLPPVFFRDNGNDGILPVDFISMDTGSRNRVFYNHAETRWTPGGSVVDGEAYTFLDPQTGWAWGKRGLYATTDGAKTWLLLPVAFGRGERATCINFIDAKNGWLVTVGLQSRVRLYRTMDGGYSWTAMIP